MKKNIQNLHKQLVSASASTLWWDRFPLSEHCEFKPPYLIFFHEIFGKVFNYTHRNMIEEVDFQKTAQKSYSRHGLSILAHSVAIGVEA